MLLEELQVSDKLLNFVSLLTKLVQLRAPSMRGLESRRAMKLKRLSILLPLCGPMRARARAQAASS